MNYAYMEMQLSGRYKEVFSRAQMYSAMKNIDSDFAEERMSDLYDLLITAQSEGKPVERITGIDDDEFCRGFFGDYTLKDRLLSFPKRLFAIAVFVLIFSVPDIRANGKDFFSADTNIMPWLIGAGAGVLLVLLGIFVITPLSHRFRKVRNESWSALVLVLFVLLMIGSVTLSGKIGLKLIVPAAPVIVAAGGYAFVYLLIRSLWRYTQYGTVIDEQKRMRKKAYSAKKLLENGNFGRDIEKKVIKTWQKRCGRYIKSGKYTAETCAEKFRKDERLNDKLECVTDIMMALIWLGSVIATARNSTVTDTLIYAAIVGVILYFWKRFVNNSMNSGAVVRKRIISGCDGSGLTMPEYLAQRYAELDKTE